MLLKSFLILISYSFESLLTIRTSAMILMNTTLKYSKNSSEENLNLSLYSEEKISCNSDNDCIEKLANSWCNSSDNECYCQKGYVLSEGACLLHCADDNACISQDINRQCVCENDGNLNSCSNKICKCKSHYNEDPSKELCVKQENSFTPIDNNGLILVCVVTGVSPLSIVLLAVCCRKLMTRNRRVNANDSSVNNSTQQRVRQPDSLDDDQQLPSYEEIAEPPPSYAEVIQGFGRKFQRSVSHFVRQISNIENN